MCIDMQELEGQVQGMKLPDNVEKAWKYVEHDLSENPVSKGVESLQKLTDPSVRAVCCRCDCPKAAVTLKGAQHKPWMTQALSSIAGLDHRLPEGQSATGKIE